MKKSCLLLGIAALTLYSCSRNEYPDINSKDNSANAINKEIYLQKFAEILSKATYERKDIREFLKKESLKQFDKNYDVLYYLIKDESIGSKSFRDILISYSSKDALEKIEANVPLLNILIPEIALFDVLPEKMDVEDREIPVVVPQKSENQFFLNGESVLKIKKGEVPDFHVIVVNENSRVVATDIKMNSLKSGGAKSVTFKSPNYDGTKLTESPPMLKSSTISSSSIVGAKAIEAFRYFNRDDGSIFQKGLQRDYVYYGITPENQTGNLNRSISEYISFIEVNPNGYFIFADQNIDQILNNDPIISSWETSQKKRPLTPDELIDRMWTKGAYNFKFEIITSTSDKPFTVYIPLKPSEIWNFNIERSYRHSTWFRRSKNTYRIDPNKFTSKPVFLNAEMISLPKWNIADEAITRIVNISEEDDGSEITSQYTFEESRINSNNFKGDLKLGIGLLNKILNIGAGGSVDITSTNTTKESKKITIKRTETSDILGSIKIYFYDPLIEGVQQSLQGNSYKMHTYQTGSITFGITVK